MSVPLVGTVDLGLWLVLALLAVDDRGQVSLGPLAESRSDLLDSSDGVVLVVLHGDSILVLVVAVIISSSTVGLGATMGQLVVIETTSLESLLEAVDVLVELALPHGGLLLGQVVVAPFLGEDSEFVQTLKGVTGWNFFVLFLSRSSDGEKGESLHSFLVTLFFSRVPYRSSDGV